MKIKINRFFRQHTARIITMIIDHKAHKATGTTMNKAEVLFQFKLLTVKYFYSTC